MDRQAFPIIHPTANQVQRMALKAKGMQSWAPRQTRRALLIATLNQCQDVINLVLLISHLKWISRNHERLLEELKASNSIIFDEELEGIVKKYTDLKTEGEKFHEYRN